MTNSGPELKFIEILDAASNILNFGVIGLTFLFAFLAFVLLWLEGRKTYPSSSMLRAIYTFMCLSILMGLGAAWFEISNRHLNAQGRDHVGNLLGDAATTAYRSGGDASFLTGRWKAEWCMESEENAESSYIQNYEEVIQIMSSDSEIFGISYDSTTKSTYWLHGRISTNNIVTLTYFSPKGLSGNLVGVLIFRSEDRFGERNLTGEWIGWTKNNQLTHGTIQLTHLERVNQI